MLLCLREENLPVTSGFLSQRASNAKSVSIPWRPHGMGLNWGVEFSNERCKRTTKYPPLRYIVNFWFRNNSLVEVSWDDISIGCGFSSPSCFRTSELDLFFGFFPHFSFATPQNSTISPETRNWTALKSLKLSSPGAISIYITWCVI